MTRRDTLQCIHEPFGDAFYFGPERLSVRYEHDEKARRESGFSESTYRTVFDRIARESAEGKRIFIKDIIHYLVPPDGAPASIAPSLIQHTLPKRGIGTNGDSAQQQKKTPYNTPAEPGNPTVVPTSLLAGFHFTFLIRDPHYSIPSYYRCTIPPLDAVTGFYEFYPSEAGYDELRRVFDYLRQVGLVGPKVASVENGDHRNGDASSNGATTNGANGDHGHGVEICVIDADDLLDHPETVIRAFCRSVGVEYDPAMLKWDTEEDQKIAKAAFEKWKGFHEDAIESTGLKPRCERKSHKSEEEFDAEWTQRFGEKGARIIRETVDRNMADYLYLKQFALKV